MKDKIYKPNLKKEKGKKEKGGEENKKKRKKRKRGEWDGVWGARIMYAVVSIRLKTWTGQPIRQALVTLLPINISETEAASALDDGLQDDTNQCPLIDPSQDPVRGRGLSEIPVFGMVTTTGPLHHWSVLEEAEDRRPLIDPFPTI